MRNFASILKALLVIAVVILIAGYAYYRTKDFVRGPVVTLHSPADGATITDLPLEVRGVALNVSYLSINDRQIYTDEEGAWSDALLLYPGYNIISVKARDRFDRSVEETLELVYRPAPAEQDTTLVQIGTSTPTKTPEIL